MASADDTAAGHTVTGQASLLGPDGTAGTIRVILNGVDPGVFPDGAPTLGDVQSWVEYIAGQLAPRMAEGTAFSLTNVSYPATEGYDFTIDSSGA